MKGKYKVLRDFYGLLMVGPRRKWLLMDGISFFLRELFRNGSYSYRVFNQYTFYTGCGDMCTMTHFKRIESKRSNSSCHTQAFLTHLIVSVPI